ECMVFLLMGGAYLRSRIKQAGKWDQETIVSFFLCQYCSGEYLPPAGVIMAGGPRCPDWFAAAVAGVGANTGIFGNKKMAASMAAREEGDVQEG
ncbi:hypothetical protein, partial [Aeromonas veronii]|uniref:hypothetical protein n=1 Tax=Aeromonas veronii TaxID=654 RepID=UPI001A7EB59B